MRIIFSAFLPSDRDYRMHIPVPVLVPSISLKILRTVARVTKRYVYCSRVKLSVFGIRFETYEMGQGLKVSVLTQASE